MADKPRRFIDSGGLVLCLTQALVKLLVKNILRI